MENDSLIRQRLLSQTIATEHVRLLAKVADLQGLLEECAQLSPECKGVLQAYVRTLRVSDES
jgi:hypothetical protein